MFNDNNCNIFATATEIKGSMESTTMTSTDENYEPTTTEAIALKSFSGSLRIISDVYTDSLANSDSSEYASKSATHEAMVIFN